MFSFKENIKVYDVLDEVIKALQDEYNMSYELAYVLTMKEVMRQIEKFNKDNKQKIDNES